MSVGPATFIVGHPRSGTSLQRAMLDGHPELTVLPFETHLFDWAQTPDPAEAVLERTRLWPTLHTHRPDVARDDVEGVLRSAFAGSPSVRERLLGLVRAWSELTGGGSERRWIEKTPRHLYEIPTFFRWFGADTRVIVVVRDPRDVMASQLKKDPSRSIFSMALTCRVAHRMVQDWVESERVHVVAYEDLVADAAGVMGPVCDFLGVSRDAAAFEPTVMGTPYGGNSRFQDTLAGVSTNPVGRYREVLSPQQQEQAEALLEDQLRAGGYMAADVLPSGSELQRLALSGVVASGLWRSRRVRRALQGG